MICLLAVACSLVPWVSVPVTVAVLLMAPVSTSAWVVVYVAVHVIFAPGASELPSVGVQVPITRPVSGSVICTLLMVVLPVLVATKV